jgi:hypothetical protein
MKKIYFFVMLTFFWNGFAEAKDPLECKEIKHVMDRLLCFGDAAKSENDLTICDQAGHEGVRYQCYYIFAMHSQDIKTCDKIPDKNPEMLSLREGCYSDLASQPAICEKIKNQGIKDGCYLKLSKKTNNKNLCKKIIDPGLRSACTGQPVFVD